MNFYDEDEETNYFHEILDLLYDYRWLYEFPVTDVLVENSLDEFPDGWLPILTNLDVRELNELVVDKKTKPDWPKTLLSFVEKCVRLDKLPRIVDDQLDDLPKSFKTGLTDKKQHEIVRLANLVHEQCAKIGIDTIVDLGSGLGYVCQLLNHRYDYRVLGLESNEKNVATAKKRQKNFYPSSLNKVKYLSTKINVESSSDIERHLKQSFDDDINDFCLIGLHACSDLGVDACKLFDEIKSAKITIAMSCCYHKLSTSTCNSEKSLFKNFPMSRTLRKIFDTSKRDYRETLQRPFLRLACQESADRWIAMNEETHREHSFCVLARAVLEFYVRKHSITLKKKVRKATRKTQCENFDTYLNDVFLRYDFIRDEKNFDPTTIRREITLVWLENSWRLITAEIYTGLQLILQSPAESMVLHDRRCWLMEMGHESEIIQVTSRAISPRSHALVSRKKN